MTSRARVILASSLVAAALLAGCSSSTPSATNATPTTAAGTSEGTAPPSSGGGTTTSVAARKLRILVTNDDGVSAAGIDAVVEGLRRLPDTEVVVVAPLTNQSGSGPKTTDGPLTVTDATTASGFPAKAVAGFPADTIIWAIDQHGIAERPDVVVSGINIGQNLGPVTEISGTVGAARAAAVRGIPSLASSQGLAATLDFPSGVKLVTGWVTKNRASFTGTTPPGSTPTPALVFNLNVPTCVTGELKQQVEVPLATSVDGRAMTSSDCETAAPAPKDDIDAFIHGYPSLSPLSATPVTPPGP